MATDAEAGHLASTMSPKTSDVAIFGVGGSGAPQSPLAPPKTTTTTTATATATVKPAAATTTSSTGGADLRQFFTDVLKGLGIPVTSQNVTAMMAWAQAEGGHAGYNPLNTTQAWTGATNYNSVGVKNYSTYAMGVAATIKTLMNGHYAPILTSLKTNPASLGTAISATPWGTSGALVTKIQTSGTVQNRSLTGGPTTTVPSGGTGTVQADAGMSIDSYGFIKAVAATEPELQKLMAAYANQDLSDPAVAARLEAQIKDTRWYKTHSDGERQQEILKAQNPAEYQRKYGDAAKQMQTAAGSLGVNLSAEALARLTKHYLAEGWNTQQINAFLVQFGREATGGHGTLQTTEASLKEQAKQYMVSMSDATLSKWSQQIAAGQVDPNSFSAYLKEQAKSLFPSLSAAIDRGVTVEQYVTPYREDAARLLEVDPNSVDFMNDPVYKQALFQIDPKTKDRTSMSLADWDTYLRKQPAYAKTHQANQQAAAFGTSLLQTFGAISQ